MFIKERDKSLFIRQLFIFEKIHSNLSSTKPNAKSNAKNQTFPELQNSSSNHSNYNNDASYHHVEKLSKNAKKIASAEESAQHAFLRNMTISDEFMKWCQDQLGYFNVDCKLIFSKNKKSEPYSI